MRRVIQCLVPAVAIVVLLVADFRTLAGSPTVIPGRAAQVTGTYISFQEGDGGGSLTIKDRAGTESFGVKDGLPVIVYADKNHPKTMSSPNAFTYATAKMSVMVSVDSRGNTVQVTLGSSSSKKH